LENVFDRLKQVAFPTVFVNCGPALKHVEHYSVTKLESCCFHTSNVTINELGS